MFGVGNSKAKAELEHKIWTNGPFYLLDISKIVDNIFSIRY